MHLPPRRFRRRTDKQAIPPGAFGHRGVFFALRRKAGHGRITRFGIFLHEIARAFFDLCLNMAGSCSRRFAGRRTNEAHTMYPVLPFDTLPGAAQTILAFFALLAAALNLMLSARA